MTKAKIFTKFLTIAAIPLILSGCYETGSAEKIGTIVKVGNGQGIFNKTIEAELIRGGFNSGTGASGQSFHFTIKSPEVAEKLKVAMDNNEEVKIKYHTELVAPISSASNATFLDSFEVMKKKIEPTQISTNSTLNDTLSGVKNTKIIQLLRVQAQLIEELAKDQGNNQVSNQTTEQTNNQATSAKLK